jgi:hypothetical protein
VLYLGSTKENLFGKILRSVFEKQKVEVIPQNFSFFKKKLLELDSTVVAV